jgi:ribosomal protein L37AE/L43A
MRLKLKQYFCNHDFYYTARHKTVSQNLWKCRKCGVYYIQSYLLDIGYKSKTPHIDGWEFENIW